MKDVFIGFLIGWFAKSYLEMYAYILYARKTHFDAPINLAEQLFGIKPEKEKVHNHER